MTDDCASREEDAREWEYKNILEQFISSMNGGIALYRITEGNAAVEFISEGAASILGLTAAEYRQLYGNDILPSIFEADRSMVLSAVKTALYENKSSSLTYRSPHKEKGYVWVNGLFSRCNTEKDAVYLRTVFTPVSQQFEAQMKILDSTSTGIYIIDRNTYELYYSNQSVFSMFQVDQQDYTGKKCYEVLFSRNSPCEYCKILDSLCHDQEFEVISPYDGRVFSIKAKETEWNGKPAIIDYLTNITAKKKAEEELRRSEEITEAAAEFAGMWLWTYDMKKNMIHCYKKLREEMKLPEVMTNYPEDFLSELGVLSEYREIFRRGVLRLQQGEDKVEFDCKLQYPDATEHWIRCRFNILSYENKKPVLAVCSSQNVDSEKTLEARIELEQKKPFANQKALLGYMSANLSKNTVDTFQILKKDILEGRKDASYEVEINRVADGIPDKKIKQRYVKFHNLKSLIDFYTQGGASDAVEFRYIFPDGRYLWVRNATDVLRDPNSGDILLYEYCYDIDKEKKAQLALDSLIDEEVDYVSIINTKLDRGRLIKADEKIMSNESWQDYNHTEMMNRLISKNVVPEDQEKCRQFLMLPNLIKLLETEKTISIVYKYSRNNKILRKRMRFFYLDETHEDIVLARRDITDIYEEERKQQQKLEQALDAANAANKAKSEFLSQMSHEIRTPMNAIMGMTKLAEDAAVNPQVKEYLQKIDHSSNYLLGILNDVLDMSRIENGKLLLKPEWVPATDIVDECINMVLPTAQARGIQFLYPDTSKVKDYEYYVDVLRTKQVMMNLLNNALKFTPEGGTVTLSARVRSNTEDFCVEEIYVTDTGCGMSQQFLQRIFTPFEQESNSMFNMVQGTGLGLALVKNILKTAGGDISVESELGRGSTFTVIFPHKYRLAQEEIREEDQVRQEINLSGKHILLVDDHPLNLEIARKLLQKKGLIVELAENGQEAVNRFAASDINYFDTILMDIKMPIMDGLAATREIRKMIRSDAKIIPVVAMTANAFEEDVQNTRAAGMNAHLAKPIKVEELYDTLAKLIAER